MTCTLAAAACGGAPTRAPSAPAAPRPSILLITLDTTRADAMGPEAVGVSIYRELAELPPFNPDLDSDCAPAAVTRTEQATELGAETSTDAT